MNSTPHELQCQALRRIIYFFEVEALVWYNEPDSKPQPRCVMARKQAEFVVSIPVEGEENLRGKFKVNVKLSLREILEMDAMRRSLLGPQGGEVGGMAALVAGTIARIQTHAVETPSWWKDSDNGLGFDDVNIILAVGAELNKVEKSHLEDIQKAAAKAGEALGKAKEE